MADAPENPAPSAAEPEPEPRRSSTAARVVYRAAKIVATFLGALLLLVALVLVGVRLYLSDERVRELLLEEANARSPAAVELRAVELSLLSGIELHGLRIGPPPGFEEDVARIERLAVHWSLWDLLSRRLTVTELAIEEPAFTLEQNASGKNLDVLLAALMPPADAPPEPPPPDDGEPFRFEQPTLPLRIEAPAILIRDARFAYLTPDLKTRVDRFGIQGNVTGDGDALALDVWVRLGQGEDTSHIEVQLAEPPTSIDVRQRLDVHVVSTGFADVKVGVDLDTRALIGGSTELPSQHLRVDVDLSADLLEQRVSIDPCEVTLGEKTRLVVRAVADHFLAPPAEQRVQLKELSLTSDLSELAPLAAVFVPGLRASGTLAITAEPLSASVQELADPTALAPRVRVALTDLGVALPGVDAADLDADVRLAVTGGKGDVAGSIRVGRARAAGQDFTGVSVDLKAASPIGPWLGAPPAEGDPPPWVEASLSLGLGQGAGEPWSATGTKVDLQARAPIALALHGSSSEPATVGLHVSVPGATGGPARVENVALTLDARGWDLGGKRADARVSLAVGGGNLEVDGAEVVLPPLSFALDAAANHDTYELRTLDLRVGELLAVALEGGVAHPAGPAPELRQLALRMNVGDLERALAAVPASLRPPMAVKGSLGIEVRADGIVDVAQLTAWATPPTTPISDPPTAEEQRRVITGYIAFVEGWAERLRTGLPLDAHVALQARQIAYAQTGVEGGLAIEGVDLDFSVDIDRHALRTAHEISVAQITAPESVRGIHHQSSMALQDGTVQMAVGASAGFYNRPELTRPLEGSGFELALTYKLGGDLLLHELAVRAPDRPFELVADGIVIKPVRMFLQNGFAREGLPGLEAVLNWRLAFGSKDLAPVAVGAPAVGGDVRLAGTITAEEGIVGLGGALSCEALSLRMEAPPPAEGEPPPPLVIDNISGDLPFDIRLAFKDTPDATPLNVEVPFGGGRVGLLTSDFDIRARPARPVHYDRLLPYRTSRRLTIDRIERGKVQITNFELDARLADGILAADRIALHVLGGDVAGELALQLARNDEVLSLVDFKISNIDAGTIKGLGLLPGPTSELSTDLNIAVSFGPANRTFALSMNVTKIGEDAFDRALQALSNNGKDETIEGYRSQARLIDVESLAVWVEHENLSVNLAYSSFMPVSIPEDLVRRFSVTWLLDAWVQPSVDEVLAPALGWTRRADTDGG